MPAVLVQTPCPIENIPSVAMEHPGASVASSADKKRNKLGYHRTSVACVHCRRRKIRCLVSADDSQGRCENCIRLRKECQFYPVDQQPPTEKKTRPGAKLESSSVDPSAASSSPPAALGTGSMDPSDMYTYPIPMHSTPEIAGFHPSGFPAAPMGTFTPDGVAHPELVPGQTIDPNASWDASAGHRMSHPSPVMWTQGQVVNPVATATPIAGMPGQPQMMPAGAPYAAVQPDGTIWPGPPQRAVTVPTQADIGGQFPSPGAFPQNVPPELKRRMTSPAQAIGPMATPSPMQSPSPVNLQVPVTYAGQPIAYRQWNGMTPMPMEGGYAMFSPGQYPMGHPGQHPSSGP